MSAANDPPVKIFVTVGAQMPFDRLVKAVDEWAAARPGFEVFAQTGESAYRPRHIESVEFIQPGEFRERVLWSDFIVSHAGMGSILMALQYQRPILVMPRLGGLRETRNDHQLATAQRFKALANLAVAMDEAELRAMLDHGRRMGAGKLISERASDELLAAVSRFIHAG